MRKSGWLGAALPNFAPRAWKLFHRATILEGWHGFSKVKLPRSHDRPVGPADANNSPVCFHDSDRHGASRNRTAPSPCETEPNVS